MGWILKRFLNVQETFPLGCLNRCVIGMARSGEEYDSSESGKGGYSRCVFMVHHHGCWIIEQKNSLWSVLCSPHTNLLPVSLPESHSFFKCLQGGCCAMLFFRAKDISNPLLCFKLICIRHALFRIQRNTFLTSDLIASLHWKQWDKKILNFDLRLFVFSNLENQCGLKMCRKAIRNGLHY